MSNKKKIEKVSDIAVDGLGSRLEALFSALGIKSCDKCKERRDWINNEFPSKMAIEMNEEELEYFATVKDSRLLKNDDLNNLEQIYFNVFQIEKKQQRQICRSCPPEWIELMKKLTKIYEIQINTKEND